MDKFLTQLEYMKTLDILEYYDGIHIRIDNSEEEILVDETNDLFEYIGNATNLIELSYITRFPSEFTFEKFVKPKNLKIFTINCGIGLDMNKLKGIDKLIIYVDGDLSVYGQENIIKHLSLEQGELSEIDLYKNIKSDIGIDIFFMY